MRDESTVAIEDGVKQPCRVRQCRQSEDHVQRKTVILRIVHAPAFSHPTRAMQRERCDVFGRGAAMRLIGRISRDRLNSQERQQSIQASFEIAVDASEGSGQSF